LLKIHTGQDDLVIGAAAVGRAHSGLEDVIGLFTNTLPLRSQPTDEKRFIAYLDEMKTLVWSALEHQQAPLERLIDEAATPRDRSRNPMFDTLFVFTDDAADTLAFDGLRMRRLNAESRVAKVDLTLIARIEADVIECRWEYATRLFGADTIRTFAGHFERVLAQLSDNPDRRLEDLDLSPDAECEALLAPLSNN
jgi:non-ribosomal peptide synthetase component F